jgi:drug/metabolite transporter (DMT)-like permease
LRAEFSLPVRVEAWAGIPYIGSPYERICMPFLGEISALVTATLWGGTSLAFTAAIRRVGSVQVNVTRMALASLFLLATVLLLDFPTAISTRQLLFLALSGIAGLVMGDSFLFMAYRDVGPRIAMLVMSLAPAISALLAYLFLGETLSDSGIAGIVVTVAGIALVVFDRQKGEESAPKMMPAGILFALIGATGQAVGLILAKEAFLSGDLHPMVATLVRIVVAVGLLGPATMVAGLYRNPLRTFRKEPRALLFTGIGALLGPYLGITGSLVAISLTKVGIAATLMATTPIVMLPMVRYITKERLSWKAITGALVAVMGVAILFLR